MARSNRKDFRHCTTLQHTALHCNKLRNGFSPEAAARHSGYLCATQSTFVQHSRSLLSVFSGYFDTVFHPFYCIASSHTRYNTRQHTLQHTLQQTLQHTLDHTLQQTLHHRMRQRVQETLNRQCERLECDKRYTPPCIKPCTTQCYRAKDATPYPASKAVIQHARETLQPSLLQPTLHQTLQHTK